MLTVYIVSHTHWDREWYHSAGRFRQRLVPLVDDLLDDPPPADTSFLLDGQTVVLDDYLAVRPERASELAALLRSGRIEAGPWFVLADELIPSGEALVRNLLAGRRALRALRADAPPVLYCPDSFGHPAALPALAQGFGFPMIVAWRGYGGRRWPDGDACSWRAASGERVLLYHLAPSGYELGANLPANDAAAAHRWREIRDQLAPRSRLDVALLPNGADHHARQRDLAAAAAALAATASPTAVERGSLRGFAERALASAGARELPLVEGELRDSYGFTWTLPGTLATRAHQKRRNAGIERLLLREVEPWSALAARRTGQSWRALTHAAWRALLLGHPHDTLCGCSIDEVARAFDARMDDAESQATGLRDDAIAAVIGHDSERARLARDAWRPHIVLRNPAARPRGGVAIVEVTRFLADVRVGPGSAGVPTPPSGTPAGARAFSVDGVDALQVLTRDRVHERTESPRAYPDDDLVERVRAAVWVREVPGFGVRALPIGAGRRRAGPVPNPVRVDGHTMANGRLRVEVGRGGDVTLACERTGRVIERILIVEDQDDGGDLYTPSPRGAVREARCAAVRAVHRGPLRGTLETRWRLQVRRGQTAELRIALTLDADAPFLRLSVTGDNRALDHRLRLRVRTDVARPTVHADAAFGPVLRSALTVPPEDSAMEMPPRTAPLHRYASLSDARHGFALISDGLAEYEAGEDGSIAVTLLRAVGELSRADLPERPGHAGWPAPTPEAQCLGPFAAELALFPHDAWSDATAVAVEQAAEDVLAPVTGATIRSLLAEVPESGGVELEGAGLVFSSIKESEDGECLVLRCVNVADREVRGRWRIAGGMSEARLARLDETPERPAPVEGDAVQFDAPPRGIVTLLVR